MREGGRYAPGGVQLAALPPGKDDRNIMESGCALRYTVAWAGYLVIILYRSVYWTIPAERPAA
jgi:hypothetical protein